eukprot:12608411-Ditylum_brightwellii.AAC.1
MACHSLAVVITVGITEQTRSGAVIVDHISGSMRAWLVFLIAAFNIESTKFVECIQLDLFSRRVSLTFPCNSRPWGLFVLGFVRAGFTQLQTSTELQKFSQPLVHWVKSLYSKLTMPQH